MREELNDYYKNKQKRIREDAPLLNTFYLVMFVLIILLLAASGLNAANLKTTDPNSRDINQLLNAIAIVESNNNDQAIGDGGKALGRYQIHKSYWIDGTTYLKVSWPYSDATDAKKARQVVRAYWKRYGKGKTIEQLARIHNGGLYGYKKKSTIKYWLKVKKVLERQEQETCK